MTPRRAKTTPASTPGSFAAHERTPPDVELLDSPTMTGAKQGEPHNEVLAAAIRRCAADFELLNSYDRGTFTATPGTEPTWSLDLSTAREAIAAVRDRFPDDELFGVESGDGLSVILTHIEQSSSSEPLYKSVEDRAAHLIYMIANSRPLADGNKRSAVALAGIYLAKNGAKPPPEFTLAALTLIAASSGPEEKDQIIGVLRIVLSQDG